MKCRHRDVNLKAVFEAVGEQRKETQRLKAKNRWEFNIQDVFLGTERGIRPKYIRVTLVLQVWFPLILQNYGYR